jgi:hypothetical protein
MRLLQTNGLKVTVTFGFIFLAILSKAFLWVHLNPMFQGPDEVQHLAMSAQLDKNGLKVYRDMAAVTWKDFEDSYDYKSDFYGQLGVITRIDKIPKYSSGGFFGPNELNTLQRLGFDSESGTDTYRHLTFAYPPLYYGFISLFSNAYRTWSNAKLVDYQFIMRLANVPLYLIFLGYFFQLSQLVSPGRWGWLSFALVCCHPMLTFMSSVVNNDVGLLPLSVALFYHSAKIIMAEELNSAIPFKRLFTWNKSNLTAHIFAISIISFGLCLVKAQGLLLSGVVLFFLSVFLLVLRQMSAFFIITFVQSSLVLLYFLQSKLFGVMVFSGNANPMSFTKYIREIYSVYLPMLIANSFGQFAWFEINFPDWVYKSFGYFLSTNSVLTFLILIRQIKGGTLSRRGRVILFLALVYLTYSIAILGWQYTKMAEIGFIIQGRYALSALCIQFLAVSFLLQSLENEFPKLFWLFSLIGVLLLGAWFSASFAGLWYTVERFYLEPSQRLGFLASLMQIEQWVFRLLQFKPFYFKSLHLLGVVLGVSIFAQIWLLILMIRSLLITDQKINKGSSYEGFYIESTERL